MSSFLGVTCPELNDIDNGTVMIKRNTFEGEAIYSCVLGFMIEGSETRVCGADGMWSGSKPSCIRKSSYIYLFSKQFNTYLPLSSIYFVFTI